MAKHRFNPLRWLTVAYRPNDQETSFLERAPKQTSGGMEVTVAVLSDRESKRFFGVPMARKGIQPVRIQVRNQTDKSARSS
jgi:hypothetical protein